MKCMFKTPCKRQLSWRNARQVVARVAPSPDPLSKKEFIKALSPEVLRMFHDAQSNILELNKSRLQALEELKVARNRIQELEQRVEELEGQRPVSGSSQDLSPAYQPEAEGTELSGDGRQTAGQASGARQDVIRLLYSTGWKKVFIHYKKQGSGWTEVPGQQMQRGTGEYEGMFVAEIEAPSIEFVLNNGDNDWDTPDPMHCTKNYDIRDHGTYRLKSGKVNKL